ncbi:hypothetical protein METESE_30290 [Mesoterricola sediminis]|uniref:Uncharacterized protein n=1 Tax=Mesoterricola sediminis TaxID=2927980 RepID=A0AA48GRS3_9BACT|nr:hypothetical protein METESE_30290 [Mesoterricola sediminis]
MISFDLRRISRTSDRIDQGGFIHYDGVVNGRRFCGSTGHRDKKQAAIWVADFKAEVRRERANEAIARKVFLEAEAAK